MGHARTGAPRSWLHEGPYHCARQAGHARLGQTRRLHPLLQAQHPAARAGDADGAPLEVRSLPPNRDTKAQKSIDPLEHDHLDFKRSLKVPNQNEWDCGRKRLAPLLEVPSHVYRFSLHHHR
jgi:hypothetical protein